MAAEYKHTQFGVLMFLIFFATGILIAWVAWPMIADAQWLAAFITLGMYLLGIALFYSFTIKVSQGTLKFWFGFGGIGKSFSLQEIRSVQEVHNPWYYFWGIKSIPGGWLYAIGPGKAVELIFKNGTMIRLGTNEPQKLIQAIDGAMASS